MQILITGGTGLIGKQLCKALLKEGHELTVLSRNPASVPAKCGAGVHAMAALRDWHSGQAFDAVINLAPARFGFSPRSPSYSAPSEMSFLLASSAYWPRKCSASRWSL